MSPTAEQCLKHFTFFLVSLIFLGKLAFRVLHNENDSTDSAASPTPETEPRCFLTRTDSTGVGLGIVEALMDDSSFDSESNHPESPSILFGFQIKTASPPLLASSESPDETSSDSETEATKNSRVGTWDPPIVIISSLSSSKMEMSEECTRVIFPRIRHIFSNIIVHNSLFEDESSGSSSSQEDDNQPLYPSSSFLSFCSFCKKRIGRQDIFMLRGERAFCSAQCRYDGILMAGEKELLKVSAVEKKKPPSVAAVKES